MNIDDLCSFLLESNQTGYAGGQEKEWVKEHDGSTTIEYTQGNFRSHDNFFGGEPYGGRLVVFHEHKPVWLMVYYGWVVEGVNPDEVYTVLREALQQIPSEAPFRGPRQLRHGEYLYSNDWQGTVERYTGREQITRNGSLVYQADYLGGLVDQRTGV